MVTAPPEAGEVWVTLLCAATTDVAPRNANKQKNARERLRWLPCAHWVIVPFISRIDREYVSSAELRHITYPFALRDLL
jgi:hypothetical protein